MKHYWISKGIIGLVLLVLILGCESTAERLADFGIVDCDVVTVSTVESVTITQGGQANINVTVNKGTVTPANMDFQNLENLQRDNIVLNGIFTPTSITSDTGISVLELQVSPEAEPGEYQLTIAAEVADSSCSTILNLVVVEREIEACPIEECPDGSFYIVGESCVLEADAIASGNLLENPGFETDAFGENFPMDAVGWSGDRVTQVSEENGITPPEGDHMLRFDSADITGSSGLSGSEIAQIYVLPDDLKDRINGGETITVRQEAFFNRIEGDANTDTEFLVLIIAFEGPTTDFPEDYLNRATLDLKRASATLSSDACTNTWERLGAQIEIPMGTNYIGVVLVAAENVENDITGAEFDGHYVDAASLYIVE
ncbi:MAG: hypothetical protein AAGD88_02625 [Bacteroidota bacterium]